MKVKLLLFGGLGLLVAGIAAGVAAVAPSGTGFAAQTMCAAVFVSHRTAASVEAEDLSHLNPLLMLVATRIDESKKRVRAAMLGLGSQDSEFRPGLGCTLVSPGDALKPSPAALQVAVTSPADSIEDGPGPLPPEVDANALQAAVGRAFLEPSSGTPRITRALLVLYKGQVVAERYGAGANPGTALPGYSLSKTVTGALTGILAGKGLVDLNAPAPVAAWHGPGDPRAEIRVEDLLHMTSGLKWKEDASDPFSDLVTMIYRTRDMAAFATDRPLLHRPGSHFAYNTGTTNILARILLIAMHGDRDAYLELPRKVLFQPAGMSSAVFEPDASDTLAGGSFVLATARDWARFGELYLHDGARNGVQILPKGWVAYSATPASAAPQGRYGALLWLNKGSPGHAEDRRWPRLPPDTMLMTGQFGQLVAVIPSHDLLIVRLGETHDWDTARDPDQLVSDILMAFRS
jgi:hypothetical protein